MTAPTREKIIGISEFAVSDSADDVLITYSLGSCVGLTLHDPFAGVGGMLHAMMPVSSMDPGRAERCPAMFTDTGVAALLQSLFDMGASRKNLVAKVAGAAVQMDQSGLFRIGERNHMVLRRVLWKNDILLAGEDVGGSVSRTLLLEVATGRTLVKCNGSLREL